MAPGGAPRPVSGIVLRGVDPTRAALIGAAAVVVIAAIVGTFADGLAPASQGLLLVVPVILTALLGGRRPAWAVAALATLTFDLVLPPVGSLRLNVAEDVGALVAFSAVAFTIGGMVAHRVEVLGRIERQRAALLRSVSHDLRTPLGSIRAAVSEVQDESLHDPAARRRLLQLVEEEVGRLDRMVENLLSLARIEGGGLAPRRQAVDLGELVQGCIARHGALLGSTEVALHVPVDLPIVLADHGMVEQVLTNLLENAVRHSPGGAPVDVDLLADRTTVRIVVSDAGPGIAPGVEGSLFEPFRSGHMAGTSGMGLAISRAIVEAHGGTIAVRASDRGGAAFTVELPLR